VGEEQGVEARSVRLGGDHDHPLVESQTFVDEACESPHELCVALVEADRM
jgi:hypothetical protein